MKNDYLNTLEESDMLLRDDFELEFDKQRILFPIECWFDVDKKFGLNTQGNDGLWVNLYGEYNPCANEVKISYVINADDGTFEREYIPTDTERELFVKLMEQACEQYTGMTCRELYITDYVAQHASGFELECKSAGDKIAIIKSGKIIKCGTMDEVKGDDSLEEVFLELVDVDKEVKIDD